MSHSGFEAGNAFGLYSSTSAVHSQGKSGPGAKDISPPRVQ